jgi:hypothetical protein
MLAKEIQMDKNQQDIHHRQIKNYLWNKWGDSKRYKEFLIELDKYEVMGAKEVGVRRWEANYNAKRKSPKLNPKDVQTSESRDILGALGELAAIKWLKAQGFEATLEKFNDTENPVSDNFDTDIIFAGQTFSVEIKATPKPMNSKLIYPLHKGKKDKQPDIFLLVCQMDEDKHCIKGFTTSDKILNNIDESLPSKAYSIHEKDLETDLNKLLNKLAKESK